jgi:alanyl-tRNA synthetase
LESLDRSIWFGQKETCGYILRRKQKIKTGCRCRVCRCLEATWVCIYAFLIQIFLIYIKKTYEEIFCKFNRLERNQIIPNGMADNFWEMGPVGPCGPCTEIYYIDGDKIMELWNLVFIEYERKDDGQLYLLQNKHVDTGMGLERLTRVLQGVQTNYDTDLFKPLFDIIQKVDRKVQLKLLLLLLMCLLIFQSSSKSAYTGNFDAGADADTAYRILADHSRAISVSLADGIFPDQK